MKRRLFVTLLGGLSNTRLLEEGVCNLLSIARRDRRLQMHSEWNSLLLEVKEVDRDKETKMNLMSLSRILRVTMDLSTGCNPIKHLKTKK